MVGWTEIDTSNWEPIVAELRGKRPKQWVRAPDGSRWLRKEPRIRTKQVSPYEPAIEWLALRLATASDVSAAEAHPCIWMENGERRSGILIRSFVEEKAAEFFLGAEVLRGHEPAYSRENWAQTVPLVRAALSAQEELHPDASLLDPFAHICAFDAWIGNADRHQENWGIVRSASGTISLAPMFDPAACLGVELDDSHALLDPARVTPEAIQKYLGRCMSGFGDGRRLIKLVEVVAQIGAWPEWSNNIRGWIASFARAMDTLEAELSFIPDSWLPLPRKRFVRSMLANRLRWLEGQV
jgi:hypothetical protein